MDEMYEKRIQEMLDLGPGQMEVFRSVLCICDRFSALDKGKQVGFRKAFDGIFAELGKE